MTLRLLLLVGLFLAIGTRAMAQAREEFTTANDFMRSVHLYPNPVVDYVQVKFDEPKAKTVRLTLYNIIGNRIEAETEEVDEYEIRIRVKDLPAGYYFIALQESESRQKGSLKFLKR